MAPQLLFDISKIDTDHVFYDAAAIEAVNPHRGVMRLLDAVVWEQQDPPRIVAYKDVGDDEFWVEGHIPGRPIFPGVLMIEAAAQCSSFISLRMYPHNKFMGFSGVNDVKFRGMVKPGHRLLMLCELIEWRPRRCICKTQGLVNGNLVFEGTITGMAM